MGPLRPGIKKPVRNNRLAQLVKRLDHEKASLRYSAFAALAGKSDLSDEITAKLRDMMYNDEDPWIRTIATLRFAALGDPAVSENLIQIIKEGSQKNKLELLRIITDNGPSTDVTVLQVIVIGLTDSRILVRLQAISAANAVKNKQLMPDLGRMLHEKHHKVRLFAAKTLYNLGRDESVDYLIELLADRSIEVHSAARKYLASIYNDHSHRIFNDIQFRESEEVLNDGEPAREKVSYGISQENIKRGLTILYNSCKNRFRGVRIEALKSIAIFKQSDSIDVVEKLLRDKFPEVRIEALHTLEKIGGRRALEAVEKMERDKKKIVREELERVLARMKKD